MPYNLQREKTKEVVMINVDVPVIQEDEYSITMELPTTKHKLWAKHELHNNIHSCLSE